MHYEGTVIRPPSEAFSIILQVTTGCSHNRCTFCGAYRDKPFSVKNDKQIAEDIKFAASYCKRQKTLFLADGNVLVLPQKKLAAILKNIRKRLPFVRRISSYANCRDIIAKSERELLQLRELGLSRIYMGLESGHDDTLLRIDKGSTSEEMVTAVHKAREAGIFLSVTSLLGIAGVSHSREHAIATGKILSRMEADQIAVLTVMVLPGTPLEAAQKSGVFQLPDTNGLLAELRTLIENINVDKGQFHANHASNYLNLTGRLPRDKDKFLTLIDQAAAGNVSLTPEFLRSL